MANNVCGRCGSSIGLQDYEIVDELPCAAMRRYVVDLLCQACGALNKRTIKKETPMNRILKIDKCQDCRRTDCELRMPCGLIPEKRPLPKGLLGYDLEHQSRGYGKPAVKPKPLLADAKVGDLVKTDKNEWLQIDGVSEPPSPVLYHYDRPFTGNIVYWQPLAKEGSSEWAWQMMLLGKSISFYDQPARCLKLSGDRIQDSNKDGHWEGKSGNEFLSYAASTGWQIYEPEHEFEVGQYVKEGKNYYVVTPSLTAVELQSGREYGCDPNHPAWKSVPAKEVALDFGSGICGTIVASSIINDIPSAISIWRNELQIAWCKIDALSEPMQSTVKSLLKRQEKEANNG